MKKKRSLTSKLNGHYHLLNDHYGISMRDLINWQRVKDKITRDNLGEMETIHKICMSSPDYEQRLKEQ